MKAYMIYWIVFIVALSSCNNKSEDSESLTLIWEFEYLQDADGISIVSIPPTILLENVLIAPDKQITSIDLESGELEWVFDIPNSPPISNDELLLDTNTLYLKEDKTHFVYALDLNNGNQKWKKNAAPGEFFEFANDGIDELYIYLSGSFGEIYRFTKSGNLNKIIDTKKYGVTTSPRSIRILENQLIFSQRWNNAEKNITTGRILSVDKETEKIKWEYFTENGGYVFARILIENGIIYAGVTGGPGEFVALNASNGEVIWKIKEVPSWNYVLSDSMVFINDSINLVALDKFTGKKLWTSSLGGGHGESNVAYQSGFVYHSHSGRLYILNANTGEIVHTEDRSPDGSPFGLIAATDGKIFVQSFYALYAYTTWE